MPNRTAILLPLLPHTTKRMDLGKPTRWSTRGHLSQIALAAMNGRSTAHAQTGAPSITSPVRRPCIVDY